MGTEFQNAYELSRVEHNNHEALQEIAALVAAGRFVVVASYPAHCRFTDAIVGEHVCNHSDHATREEADAAADDMNEWYGSGRECFFCVQPARPEAPRPGGVSVTDDEIPF